eukprot:4903663-Ditylum_brightwellii.AAC.1
MPVVPPVATIAVLGTLEGLAPLFTTVEALNSATGCRQTYLWCAIASIANPMQGSVQLSHCLLQVSHGQSSSLILLLTGEDGAIFDGCLVEDHCNLVVQPNLK